MVMPEPHAGDSATYRPAAPTKTSFTTQTSALLRKSLSFQRRNLRSTLVTVQVPIYFCVLLAIIQAIVNSALDSYDNKCGCQCLRCCNNRNDTDICFDATPEQPCIPGNFDSCKNVNKANCGFEFSDGSQAGFCANPAPSTWPSILQVPLGPYRAKPYSPNTAAMYTGDDRLVADTLAGLLFATPKLTDPARLRAATQYIASGNAAAFQNLSVGLAIASLGYTLGTDADPVMSYQVESAFVNATAVDNMVRSCATDTSTAALQQFLQSNGGNAFYYNRDFACTGADVVWQPSAAAINRALYCGYRQAHCDGSYNGKTVNGYMQAWDFSGTSQQRLQLNVWVNDTSNQENLSGQQPPNSLRINKAINMATNAWLRWVTNTEQGAVLMGMMSMPSAASKLTLDFSSLLGPLFFTWIAQLLMPMMLSTLVYEKEQKLRIMMKMHGLSEAAYWSVQYLYFAALYAVYILVLIAFASAIQLGFFLKTSYAFTIVFFLLWGNTLVAFTFLASVFFTSTKTARVCAFLYVFATGLLSTLLLSYYMGQDQWWCNLVELIPAFALFRGLYEMSQYSFRAGLQGTEGLTFSKFSLPGNGLGVVFGILVGEWVLFLVLAWYLEQVLPSGAGVRRKPLFFLDRWRRQPSAAAGQRSHAPELQGVKVATEPGTVPADATASMQPVGIEMEGDDVARERARVEGIHNADGYAILMRDLRKVYPAQDGNPERVACRDLTMGVREGECFGLLGPNGAGKTTAISILVGLMEPTSGSAEVHGLSVEHDMAAIYGLMGVCPQHDLLWEQLTAREHLLFYARLKNLREPELSHAVEKTLKSLSLWAGGVADKPVGRFSGGMKRRLSVGISLVGHPAVVYMDEPSTGLDPASRRNLWRVVKEAKAGRGIILTTHSMEEAEVLCDRIGIFVEGQLVCIGSPKELTSRYGEFLVLTIMTPPDAESLQRAEAFVQGLAPSARRTYVVGGTQRFELPMSEVSLSHVFTAMENSKGRLQVLDWGVANATLEEVFIKFALSRGLKGGR